MSDKSVASAGFAGSFLSASATGLLLVVACLFEDQRESLRHNLVSNLFLADFLYFMLSSVATGKAIAGNSQVTPGPLCTLGGWLAQFSIQAIDFAMLAITLVTLHTIVNASTRTTRMPEASLRQRFAVCGSIWIIPIVSASIAASLGSIQPVNGGYCWIAADRTALRFALAHGWRIGIIATTIGIYSYVYYFLARHSAELETADLPGGESQVALYHASTSLTYLQEPAIDMSTTHMNRPWAVHDNASIKSRSRVGSPEARTVQPVTNSEAHHMQPLYVNFADRKVPSAFLQPNGVSPSSTSRVTIAPSVSGVTDESHAVNHAQTSSRRNQQERVRRVKRMLLMNGYPIAYIVLSLPAIIGRRLGASGAKPETLAILQVPTQYIGLCNALTYGFNAVLRERLVQRWHNA